MCLRIWVVRRRPCRWRSGWVDRMALVSSRLPSPEGRREERSLSPSSPPSPPPPSSSSRRRRVEEEEEEKEEEEEEARRSLPRKT